MWLPKLHVERSAFVWRAVLGVCLSVTLLACGVPRPTIKIALVAPFEGRFREVGYDAFPAMRLALRQQIEAGGIGNYEVEFVAYNDNADPAYAERVAHNVVLDERVMAVVGHLRADTTRAAQPVYTAAGLAFVVPSIPADQAPTGALVFRLGPTLGRMERALTDSACPGATTGPLTGTLTTHEQAYRGRVPTDTLALLPGFQSAAATGLLGSSIGGLCFASAAPYPRNQPGAAQPLSAFSQVSGGFQPGPGSISTYDATRLILAAIRADIAAHGTPTREGVAEALRHETYDGLLGQVTFDASNTWASAPVWVYQYDASGKATLRGSNHGP